MTGSPLVGIPLVVFLLFAMSPLLAEGGLDATGFPVPERIVPLSAAVTPREYGEIGAAIKKEIAKPKVSKELQRGPGLGQLKGIVITRVPLGTLGEGMMVDFLHSPSCGNGGCPMWLFLRGPQGYRNLIKGGGWGFSLLPSGQSSPAPDIAFYWQMGAGETDVAQYHFAHGQFVPVVANPAKCGGEDDTRGACAGRSSPSRVSSISSAEYDSLGRELQAELAPSAAALRPSVFAEAHAIDFPLVNDKIARVVGLGRCSPESNCTISIYGCQQTYPHATSHDRASAEVPECEYWPMLRGVSGWGIADVSDFTADPFSPRAAFVIVRGLSANKVELTRYSVVIQPSGPKPGNVLSRDSCQIASLEAGKSRDEYSARMLTPPEPCADNATAHRPGEK